jgi:hypothetical protein
MSDDTEALEILLNGHAGAKAGDAYSELELVKKVIEFVNKPTLDDELKLMLRDDLPDLKRNARPVLIPRSFEDHYASLRQQFSDRTVAEETKDTRARIATDLQSIIDDCLTAESIKRLTRSAAQQAQLPVFEFDSETHLQIRFIYVVNSVTPVLDYAVLLMADSVRSFRKDLCRCKLPSCRRFFLVDRNTGGRPRKDYCKKTHMEKSHAAGTLERVRTARAKKAKRKRDAKFTSKSGRYR